jgi:hypothetical protein
MRSDISRLDIHFHPVASLGARERGELWALYNDHVDTTPDVLEASLSTCDEVITYRHPGDARLLGMTLVAGYSQAHQGRSFRVVWTGSVVLRPEARGKVGLERAGLHWMARERLMRPFGPLYWFFDTFSVHSYLLMPRSFRTYWPRHDLATPEWERGAIDLLARRHYGARWDPAAGIIRRSGNKRLRESPPRREDVHTRYFEQLNPGFREGDLLPCLVPLDAVNLATLVGRTARYLLGSGARAGR